MVTFSIVGSLMINIPMEIINTLNIVLKTFTAVFSLIQFDPNYNVMELYPIRNMNCVISLWAIVFLVLSKSNRVEAFLVEASIIKYFIMF